MNTQLTPFPLGALAQAKDNQPISCIEGTISKLYGRKDGTAANGPWSIQNGEITDAQGCTVPLFIKDRDELPQSLKGKRVRIESTTGQHGMKGIVCFADDYGGKTTHKVKVTKAADIMLADGESGQQAPAQNQAPTDGWPSEEEIAAKYLAEHGQPAHQPSDNDGGQAPANQAPAQSQAPAQQTSCPGVPIDTKKMLLQTANMHLLCALAVQRYEAPLLHKLTGRPMDTSQIQGATASLFIKMDRADMIHTMPTRPLTEDELAGK